MSSAKTGMPAEPFFLKVGAGQRFCLYHPPHSGTRPAGALIYVHPFAEELNRSRRMAALQAHMFAAAGMAVLQIDLSGCGDSSGDFSDASWASWKEDLAAAWDWLQARLPGPIGLWGLRLGALLALAFAQASTRLVDRLVLWQPVVSGESFLTQFLRMRLASDMLRGLSDQSMGTQQMREALARGETLEVAGYALAPSLAASIDTLKLAELAVTDMPVHWFEIVTESDIQLPPAAARIVDLWTSQGVDLHTQVIPGDKFWMSPEIAECPALLSATTSMLA
jgi:exosortase A-associated hydrolase 2